MVKAVSASRLHMNENRLRRTEPNLRRKILKQEALKAVRRATPRMDQAVARFAKFLAMTPKEHAIFASIPNKVHRFARNLFRDRVRSVQTFGSVRSGLASIVSDSDITLNLIDGHGGRSLQDLLVLKENLTNRHGALVTQEGRARPTLSLSMYNLGVQVNVESAHNEAAAVAMEEQVALNPLVKPLVLILAHATHKHGLCIPTFIIANLVLFHFQISPPSDHSALSAHDIRRFMHLLHNFDFAKEVVAINSPQSIVERTDHSGHPVFMTNGDTINLALAVGPDIWHRFFKFVDFCHARFSYVHTRMLVVAELCTASKAFLERRAHLAQIPDGELAQDLLSVPAVPAPSEFKKPTADKVDHGSLKGTWRAAKRFKFGRSEAHDDPKGSTALLGIEKDNCEGLAIDESSGLGATPPLNGSITGSGASTHTGLGCSTSGDDFVIVEASDAAGSEGLSQPGTGEHGITISSILVSRPISNLARSWKDDLEGDDDSEYIFINYPKRGTHREHELIERRSPPNPWHAEVRMSPKSASSRPRRLIRTIHDITESILSRNAPKRQDSPLSEPPAPKHSESKDDRNDRKRKRGPGDCVMM